HRTIGASLPSRTMPRQASGVVTSLVGSYAIGLPIGGDASTSNVARRSGAAPWLEAAERTAVVSSTVDKTRCMTISPVDLNCAASLSANVGRVYPRRGPARSRSARRQQSAIEQQKSQADRVQQRRAAEHG